MVRLAIEVWICHIFVCPDGLLEPFLPSYLLRNSFSFPGVQQPGREFEHLPQSSAEVKNEWRYVFSSLPLVFMAYRGTTLMLLCIRVYWYLMVLLAAQITQCPTAGWLMKNELEKLWTEAIVLNWGTILTLPRKMKKNRLLTINKNPSLNPGTPEYGGKELNVKCSYFYCQLQRLRLTSRLLETNELKLQVS